MRASVPVCVSNWAVLRVGRALESMLVGHRATKPPSHQASEQPPWWGGRQPPCHLVSLPSCPPPPPLHRAPLSPGWNVPPRRGAPRDVCLTTNKGFRLGAQVRKTFYVPSYQGGLLRCPLPAFTKNPTWVDRGTNPNNNLHRTSCFYHAVYRFWLSLAGSPVFPAFTSLQASTTPTYKAYTRFGEDRGCV